LTACHAGATFSLEEKAVSIKNLLAEAAGRAIVVGENHIDRKALMKIRGLIRGAHSMGYRKLGLELAHTDEYDDFHNVESLGTLLRSGRKHIISEYDETGRPTVNFFYYSALAVELGWDLVGVDPLYRERGRVISAFPLVSETSDLAIANAIRSGGVMVVVLGMRHMPNIRMFLEDTVMFVSSMKIPKDGSIRNIYRRQLGDKLFEFVDSLPSIP
jgi:hypothetical protein